MLTSMSRIIGCFTVSVSTLFAIACSAQLIPCGFIFTCLLKGLRKNKRSVQQTKLSFTVRCTLGKMSNFSLNSKCLEKWFMI